MTNWKIERKEGKEWKLIKSYGKDQDGALKDFFAMKEPNTRVGFRHDEDTDDSKDERV